MMLARLDRFRRGVLVPAVAALGLSGCALFKPDAVPETDEEWWADYEKRADPPGIQVYPFFGRSPSEEVPERATVDDPEYQEYLDWKAWQDFRDYQEWKREQGATGAAAGGAPTTAPE